MPTQVSGRISGVSSNFIRERFVFGHDPWNSGVICSDWKPDVVAEIDQHKKVTKKISSFSEFQSIVEGCLSTTENVEGLHKYIYLKGVEKCFLKCSDDCPIR